MHSPVARGHYNVCLQVVLMRLYWAHRECTPNFLRGPWPSYPQQMDLQLSIFLVFWRSYVKFLHLLSPLPLLDRSSFSVLMVWGPYSDWTNELSLIEWNGIWVRNSLDASQEVQQTQNCSVTWCSMDRAAIVLKNLVSEAWARGLTPSSFIRPCAAGNRIIRSKGVLLLIHCALGQDPGRWALQGWGYIIFLLQCQDTEAQTPQNSKGSGELEFWGIGCERSFHMQYL